MTQSNTRLGIILMVTSAFVFGLQDLWSRRLAGEYNVIMIVMIRYWFFLAFVFALAARAPGGWRSVARTRQPVLQIGRGVLLVVEICVMVGAFVLLGLVESHAIFACYPLLIAAFSGRVLGEKVGWRRWAAIGAGFVGLLVILQPGSGVFSLNSLVALLSALLFAVYGLLTRYAARQDDAMTSFFWTAAGGFVAINLIGPFFWEPMTGEDWVYMVCLAISGATGHWLLIKTYEVAEASAVQPFAYFQLVFASGFGIIFMGEALRTNVAIGAGIIIAAGVFTALRERAGSKTRS